MFSQFMNISRTSSRESAITISTFVRFNLEVNCVYMTIQLTCTVEHIVADGAFLSLDFLY